MSQHIQCFLQTSPFQNHHLILTKDAHSNFSLPPKPKFKYISDNLNKIPTKFNKINVKFPKTQIEIPSKIIHPSSYSSLIQTCIDTKSFDVGKSIHTQMLSVGFRPDTYLQTKILMLYARSGDSSDVSIARQLFDEMPERNSTSWNTMILAYARENDTIEVMDIFFQMQRSGIVPDKFTFPSVIDAFVALEDSCGFQQVQGLILKTGLNRNLVVGSTLVNGYVRFGSMEDAVTAFDEIDGENVVIWNAVISGYVRLMRWEEAWEGFYRMQSLGVVPDHFTFAMGIRVCGALRSQSWGQQVHAKLIISGFESDIFVCNSLIDMYAKCGDMESCSRVFHLMEERNQVTWNSMISSKAQLGCFDEALLMFVRMLESGYESDRFNLGSVIMSCAGLADTETGRELHGYLIRKLLDTDVILGSALVDMYSKSGCVEVARRAFERLLEKNEVSWNALIAGYIQVEQGEEALELYHKMEPTKIRPDQFTYASLLTLSAYQGNEDQGKQIHAHIIRTVARQHIILETELVHMYAKCRRLNDARKIFNRMEERNAYTWNSIIEGCEENDEAEEALELFHQMQLTGIKPDCFSLVSSLSACMSLSNGKRGMQIHGFIVRNAFEEHGILRCMLVDMYAKCGDMNYASKAYENTRKKDVVLHNVMVSGFVSCGRIDDAKRLFDHMTERSTISWNSILTGYAKSGFKGETFKLFQKMVEGGIEFDGLTLVTMFNLCAGLLALEKGKQLHACVIKNGFTDSSVVLDSAMVDMYSKCGSIKEARRIFNRMNSRNVVSWNAMITGYAKHGYGEVVLNLFDRMQKEGVNPNDITFLSVLSACSHTGLVEEGLRIFIAMVEEHRIEARGEHYTCMVDLLGRAGLLEEAKEVIESMPIDPEVSTWGALLGACRVHQNVDTAKFAAESLFEMDPKNPGHYVLMSNIYAAEGRWKEVEEVRNLMKTRGVIKDPGVSWIEIDNEIHTFRAGDQSHSQSEEIYTTLKGLSSRMKGMGYVPDTHFILRNLEEVGEDYLLQHSERLAIALGLIQLQENVTIRVFKNLRICGDCHTVTKLISKITGRRIIVRDTNRFHHFENGMCSCGDFW